MGNRQHLVAESSTAPKRMQEEDRFARLLLGIVDGGLAGSVLVVPMLLGGRHGLGQFTLVALAVAVALAWTLRQCLRPEATWRRSAAEWLLLAGVILALAQLVSLSPALLGRLAPHTSEILPLWNPAADSSVRLGVWSQISLTPSATRGALAVFLAYGLLFLVTVQRIRTVEDVERLVRWCALSALLMAAFGLVQLLAGNGKFFWVYEHPYTDTHGVAKGAFSNRNHFAHFLALGLGPMIWWVQQGFHGKKKRRFQGFNQAAERSQDLKSSLRVIALGVVMFAVLMSLSRGGALAALLAAAIGVAVSYRASRIGFRFVATLGTVALLIAVSLGIVGYERVSQRLGTLTSASLEEMDRGTGRRTIWSTVIKAIPDYALLGSGLGSHRDVYPMYLEQAGSRKYFSHAESGYLQVALESGLLGLGLVLAGVVVCGFWCVTGLRNSSSNRLMVCMGAVSASLAASAAHSLVDFVWYVPGCMAMVAVLAGCACRLCQLATDRDCPRRGSIVVPRPLGMAAVLVLLTVGLWMLQNRLGPAIAQSHWEHYLMLSRDEPDLLLFDEQPADGSGTDAEHQSTLAAKQKIVAELEEVVRRDPDHARAHVRLAKAYVRLFHQRQKTSANVMPVSQIRDAVFGSQAETVPPERRLDSRRRLERWLSQAIGDHYRHLDVALRHTRQGLALCPLLGEGYLLLGELCFLDGGSAGNKTACIAQALKVRPFDGDVLFHAGNEAVLAGDRPQGLAYWQQSFRAGKVYQEQIINRLVGRVFPMDLKEEIKIFLRAFQPGLDGLRAMDRRYQEIAPPEQMVPLYQVYAETAKREAHAKKGQEAAALLLEAMALYGKLDLPAECLQCGRSALECNPYDFYVRKKVAYCFAGVGQFAEAREHLEWCLKRKPGNKRLQEDIREILRQEIQQTRQTTLTDQVAEDPRTHHPLQEDRGDLRQSARPPIVPSSAIEPTGNF